MIVGLVWCEATGEVSSMHFSCMKFFGGLFIYVILPNYALGILNKRAISLFYQVQLFQSMKSHITFSSQIIY